MYRGTQIYSYSYANNCFELPGMHMPGDMFRYEWGYQNHKVHDGLLKSLGLTAQDWNAWWEGCQESVDAVFSLGLDTNIYGSQFSHLY